MFLNLEFLVPQLLTYRYFTAMDLPLEYWIEVVTLELIVTAVFGVVDSALKTSF